jgi:hypothetical protein
MNRVSIAVCLSVSISLAACRMADGPMPNPKADEVPNQLGDLGRDLSGVVNGDTQARQDFMDDLMVFVDLQKSPGAEAPVKALGAQVIDAAVATKPSEAATAPLLEHLYVAIAARELSEGQVKTLEENVQAAASRIGLDDVKARALAAQAGIVQQAVTERHRRWYEVF